MKDMSFQQALMIGDAPALRKVPKADKHNHCGLGMRFATFNAWAGGKVAPPPPVISGIAGLESYLNEHTLVHANSQSGFEFLAESTIQAAIEDGVTVLETSIDCCNLSYYQVSEQFFDYISSLKRKYEGIIDFRPDIGANRAMPPHLWEQFFVPALESGLFMSVDLYGNEIVNNLELYQGFFRLAQNNGLKIKAHVGEFCGPLQILETIEALNPDELQHGIGSVDDSSVIAALLERGIGLNICPTSNIRLGAVSDIKSHPMRRLYDLGVSITVNTDDLMLFDNSVSEEFVLLYKSGLFSAAELDEIRLNGLQE